MAISHVGNKALQRQLAFLCIGWIAQSDCIKTFLRLVWKKRPLPQHTCMVGVVEETLDGSGSLCTRDAPLAASL